MANDEEDIFHELLIKTPYANITLVIPQGVSFDQLEVISDAHTGRIAYNKILLCSMCTFSHNAFPAILLDYVLKAWYSLHLKMNGAPNVHLELIRLQDKMIAEGTAPYLRTPRLH